jgi:hypothetical protein
VQPVVEVAAAAAAVVAAPRRKKRQWNRRKPALSRQEAEAAGFVPAIAGGSAAAAAEPESEPEPAPAWRPEEVLRQLLESDAEHHQAEKQTIARRHAQLHREAESQTASSPPGGRDGAASPAAPA